MGIMSANLWAAIALGILATACHRGPERVAPWTYAISCGRHQQDCYTDAAARCRYGFAIQDSQPGGLLVRCDKPRFCTRKSDCRGSERCYVSRRYEGKRVCL